MARLISSIFLIEKQLDRLPEVKFRLEEKSDVRSQGVSIRRLPYFAAGLLGYGRRRNLRVSQGFQRLLQVEQAGSNPGEIQKLSIGTQRRRFLKSVQAVDGGALRRHRLVEIELSAPGAKANPLRRNVSTVLELPSGRVLEIDSTGQVGNLDCPRIRRVRSVEKVTALSPRALIKVWTI